MGVLPKHNHKYFNNSVVPASKYCAARMDILVGEKINKYNIAVASVSFLRC